MGGEEYFGGDGVALVEWGERIEGLLPADAVRIRLEKDPARSFGYRRITVGKEAEA